MEINDLYEEARRNFKMFSDENIKYLFLLIDTAYLIGGRDEIRKRIAEMEANG